ncbi:variable surface protein [Plasmodium gonderi]|uniref:Variable surface protein n=1 Tax=Plasmodium gonderi TaxID=77519 RepID=A0A1Y1JR24_PLAGO|nr:variable surface protein [Plasmodium gonderi]GAW83945.1 variable surface protein [Plasmodium gonderi]
MSDAKKQIEKFNFTGIFPTCTSGYKWQIYQRFSDNMADHFTRLCSQFRNAVTNNNCNTEDFVQWCQVLIVYLNRIKNNESMFKPEVCCKYFYYKLKKLLLNRCNCTCKGIYECYEKMTQIVIKNLGTIIPDVCIKYPINIDENTFIIFGNLDELINRFNEFISNYHSPNYSDIKEFIRLMKLLEKTEFKNNESIRLLLKEYEDQYKIYLKKFNERNPILYYLTKDGYINGILNVESLTKEGVEVIGAQTDFTTGTGTGIGFLAFAILVIVFILYKYTPYFSFLHSRAKRLRKKLKKNYKNNLCFKDTFDFEYKNSTDNTCKIAYRSISYNQ